MGTLQEVAGVAQSVEPRTHPLRPCTSPRLGEHVILASPDEVRVLVPAEKRSVVQRLGRGIAVVRTANRNREREPAHAVVPRIRQATVGCRKPAVHLGSLARERRVGAADNGAEDRSAAGETSGEQQQQTDVRLGTVEQAAFEPVSMPVPDALGVFVAGVVQQVFMMTRRSKRSGIIAACARPMGPPQSWQTTVTRCRSRVPMSEVRISVCRAIVYQWMSVGLSERPKPMWSGAMQR